MRRTHRHAAFVAASELWVTTCRSAEAEEAENGENDDDGAYEPNDIVHWEILFGCELVTDHNASRSREFHRNCVDLGWFGHREDFQWKTGLSLF